MIPAVKLVRDRSLPCRLCIPRGLCKSSLSPSWLLCSYCYCGCGCRWLPDLRMKAPHWVLGSYVKPKHHIRFDCTCIQRSLRGGSYSTHKFPKDGRKMEKAGTRSAALQRKRPE